MQRLAWLSPLPAIALTLCLGSMLGGCGAFDFNMDQAIDEVIIPGAGASRPVGAPLPSNIIPPQNFTTELTDEPAGIFVDSMTVTITGTSRAGETPPDSLEFIDAMIFYAESTKPGSGLARAPIAWTEKPGEVDEVDLEVNRAVNLLPYILEGLRFSSDVAGRVPRSDVSIRGNVSLFVDVL